MTDSEYTFITKVHNFVFRYSQFSEDVCSYIGCLFALESSYGCSNLAKEFSNYCGMKIPLLRISTALNAGVSSEGSYWAEYGSLKSCVIDFLLCLQYQKPKYSDYDTVPHFAFFISKFYCPEKDYIAKINSIYSQFKNYKNER